MEQLRLAPSQMLPRGQLKKPLRDILRDISKRSMANVDMRGGPNGSIIFEGKGSADAVRQALKEVAQQVGSKVCSLPTTFELFNVNVLVSNLSAFPSLPLLGLISLENKALSSRTFSSERVHGSRFRAPRVLDMGRMMTTMILLMC